MQRFETQFRSNSEQHTHAIGRALAAALHGGDVVALYGPLGSGKTCLVRGMAEGLGANASSVSSPTFVICHEYQSRKSSMRLVHIDAYRLSGSDELETIGWDELQSDENAVIAVEWPSRVEGALPVERINITFVHDGEHSRLMSLTAIGDLAARLQPMKWPAESPIASPGPLKCRTCGTSISQDIPTYPFCSQRCKLADLGKWFNEGFRISRAVEADDELED